MERSKMRKCERESVFDSLRTTVEECIKSEAAVEIPQDIWSGVPADKLSAASKNPGYAIRSFNFELNGEYFVTPSALSVNSLFFEYILNGSVTLKPTRITRKGVTTQRNLSNAVARRKIMNTDQFFALNFVSGSDFDTNSLMLEENIIEKVLRGGIKADGSVFNLLGCSNSQVQKRSFYFMRGSRNYCEQVINQLINLRKMNLKGVAKRTKYVGLLFTGCQHIVHLPEELEINSVQDIERNEYNFTDGCGIISLALAEWVWKNNSCVSKKWSYIPSVWQIRYYGDGKLCKGVLVVDNREKTKFSMSFRPSMVKVEVDDINSKEPTERLRLKLGIVSTNHIARVGKLNKQVIALLSGNIAEQKLQSMQDSFLHQTQNARTDSVAALQCYSLKLKLPMFERLLRQHKSPIIPSPFVNLPKLESLDPEKLKIPIACSRILIGASFPEAFQRTPLREGECLVLTELRPILGEVVVYRSPSYSPGDIRVLKAVEPHAKSPVYDLKNVILFSTEGSRPDPDKMSGGDLDGDLYLVIWDQRILEHSETLRKVSAESYEVPMPQERSGNIRVSKEDNIDWIRYVAQWENSMLAQIDSTFFKLASKEGINSKDCKELSALFSRAVDQIPSDLDQLKRKMAKTSATIDQGPFVPDFESLPIWERMLQKQKSLLEKIGKTRTAAMESSDWARFFETLVSKIEIEIVEILNDKNITETANGKQIKNIRNAWILLSSKHFQPPLPRNIQSKLENLPPLCIFDCAEQSCTKGHPETLEWHNSWTEKVKIELNSFIQPFQDKIDRLKEVLTEQERRRKFALILYVEKCDKIKQQKEVLMKKLRVVEKHRNKVDATLSNAVELENLNLELEAIEKEQEPGFFTNFLRGVQNKLAKVFLKRKRKLTDKEIKLIEKYNEVQFNINEKWEQLNCTLKVEQTSYQVVEVELRPMFNTPNFCFNETIESIRSRQKSCESLKKVIIDKSKSYQYPNMSEEVYNMEANLKSKIVKITNRQTKLLARKQYLTNLIAQISNSNSRKQNTQSSVPSLWNLSQTLVVGCLKGKLFDTEQELEKLNKRKVYLEENLNIAYSLEIHQKTLDGIETVTEKVNPFNLALCAALNEVNSRLGLYSAEISNRRVGSNNELKMCLLREKNRCKQECSEKQLPIFSKRFEIMSTLKEHNAMIVVAHTGSGKSTQVPQYLADDLHHVLKHLEVKKFPRIACTQPRRVAATSIAQRVSLEYSGSIDSAEIAKGKQEDSKPVVHNSKKAEVVAYPLYASSGSEKRALDHNDRLGWYEQLPSHLNDVKTDRSKHQDESLIAKLAGTPGEVGGWVGFQIGSRGQTVEQKKESKKISLGTRIEFVTEGLLLQKLKNQQESTTYDCVIVDEAHERGKDTDFLMALLRTMLKSENCKLKVVVMSASINQQQFSEYFGNCPIIECEGKMFDVEEIYKPVPEKLSVSNYAPRSKRTVTKSSPKTSKNTRSEDDNDDDDEPDMDSYMSSILSSEDDESQNELFSGKNKLVHHAVDILFREVHSKEKGDVLIFLPGKKEIHTAVQLIKERAERVFVHNISSDKPGYVRKVVCCTNIAETSLTIPGVKFVIDVGQAKKITYDHELRISALVLSENSQASAKQRKGRAGRIESGYCYRLCSEEKFGKLEEFDTPELKQCPIDELYLYAVSIFGSMEELELMPDAEPCKTSLEFAKQRLLNLEFIQVGPDNDKAELTSDGKLAVSLLGELSMEDIRMILAARDNNMIKHALQLAVLMKNSSDLQVKDSTVQMKEKFKLYIDELGDAFTWFKIYTTYLEIKCYKQRSQMIEDRAEWNEIKSRGVKKWSDDLGLSLPTLQLVDKSVDSVYQTLKRQKMLGSKFIDLDIPLDELRLPLLKALIAGYFHNTAELHDIDYLKAGYSMLTSGNIERPLCQENETNNNFSILNTKKHNHLLKLELSNRSSLTKHGDVVQNTYLVFTNLYKTVSTGRVFMEQACRVTPEMIFESSNMNWRKQCHIRRTLSADKLQSVVTRHSKEFVGPKVLGKVLKTNQNGHYLKDLEEECGAKVHFMFEHGQIRLYGSQCEVKNVLEHSKLMPDIMQQRKKYLESDFKVSYPLGKPLKLGCFEPGLRLDFETVTLDAGETTEDWKSISKRVVIFRKIDHNKTEALLKNLDEMKLNCHEAKIKNEWGEPKIPENAKWIAGGIPFCKVIFRSENVAKYVCDKFASLKKRELSETHCFLDSNVEIPVIDTRIYPSVMELGTDDRNIKIRTRGGNNPCFVISPKNRRNGDLSVDNFREKLVDEDIFSSRKVQNVNFGFPSSYEQENNECLNRVKNKVQGELEYCKILIHPSTNPFFEIFGDDKNEAVTLIEKEIAEIRTFPMFYYAQIKLERHQMVTMLRELDSLRKIFPEVKFYVKCGSYFSRSDLIKPSIYMMTREKAQYTKCYAKINGFLRNNSLGLNMNKIADIHCCICLKEVKLLKYIQKNDKSKQIDARIIDMNKTMVDSVKCLTLCGCIYCPSCLYITVTDQIQTENFPKTGLKCVNVSKTNEKRCDQIIMNQDVKDNLTCKLWEQTLNNAWNSHVQFSEKHLKTKKIALQTCPWCKRNFAHDQNLKGVFSCSKCTFSPHYCVKCKCRVRNGMEFKAHQKRCK